jgi:hypothetical protein
MVEFWELRALEKTACADDDGDEEISPCDYAAPPSLVTEIAFDGFFVGPDLP